MEGRPLDESELIARAVAGDDEAYEQLVTRYADLAFRTAVVLTGSAADAEEAAQDAFLAAHRALVRFQTGLAFRPWLLRIVANAARNRRRAQARRARHELSLATATGAGDSAPSPEAAVQTAEERRALLRAVAALDDAHRTVIQCRFFLELDVADTAAVVGCAEGTVKSRLSRALSRLRAQITTEQERP